jgi:hypothetical protein
MQRQPSEQEKRTQRLQQFGKQSSMQAPKRMSITVPQGFTPGQQLLVSTPEGAQMHATIPNGIYPGQTFQIQYNAPPPAAPSYSNQPPLQQHQQHQQQSAPYQRPAPQQLTVTVPAGIGPGHQFQIRTPDGQTMNVTVPAGTGPGQNMLVSYSPQAQQQAQQRVSQPPVSTFQSRPSFCEFEIPNGSLGINITESMRDPIYRVKFTGFNGKSNAQQLSAGKLMMEMSLTHINNRDVGGIPYPQVRKRMYI